MKLVIQNMVSHRCIMMVKSELDKLGIAYKSIKLGEVDLAKPISCTIENTLKNILHESGLELIHEKKEILIEKIINIIVEMIHYSKECPKINFSEFLSEKLHQDYHQMAMIFSKKKGITIEHFIIMHKVEKIKELIIDDNFNLTEISYKMHYSNVAHLSRQFKQVTGVTPTTFKSLAEPIRCNLEDI